MSRCLPYRIPCRSTSNSRASWSMSTPRSTPRFRRGGPHRNFQARADSTGVYCTWPDMPQETLFPYVWLRDACQDEASVHPSAKQKYFRTSDVPKSISAKTLKVENKTLKIEWSHALSPTDPQTSIFESDFLRRYTSQKSLDEWQRWNELQAQSWTAQTIDQKLVTLQYGQGLDTPSRIEAARALQRDGLVLFRSVDTRDTSEEGCELVHLAQQLGTVRKTWYGLTFDVKSLNAAKNIAYTNLDLGFHQDLVHFDDPPRYQFLHYLYGHPTLQGGQSRFVDSYAVIEEIKRTHPEHYQALCELPVAFEYKNDGRWRYAERPTIEHDEKGQLVAVNYSPPFQGPLPLHRLGSANVNRLRDALATFDAIADDPRWAIEMALQPGDCVGFDNRRVLHARTSFSWDATGGGSSQVGRHLKGLYVEGDSVRETYRVLAEAS